MAGFLSAIGRASPAITGQFKDYLDTAKDMREEEQNRQAFEMKQETHATQQAVSGLTISKLKRDETAAQKKEAADNAIVDVNPMYSALKLNPGFRETVDTIMNARGVKGGIGAAKNVREATKDLEQHPLLPKLIEGQIEYVRSGYMVAKQEYDKIVEKKGKPGYDINKEYEAHKNLKEWEKNGVALGLVDKKIKEREEDKKEINEFMVEFKDEIAQMPASIKGQLTLAAKMGDKVALHQAYQGWQKMEQEALKGKSEKPLSTIGKLQYDRDKLIKSGIPVTDPRIQAMDAEIKKRGTIKPTLSPSEKLTTDADKFFKAVETAKKTEGTALFTTRLSESEEQRAESKRRQKTINIYKSLGGNVKKFDGFWSEEKGTKTQIDQSDIETLKGYSTPEQANDHVERAYRANLIGPEVRDQALAFINQNRKVWGKWKVNK